MAVFRNNCVFICIPPSNWIPILYAQPENEDDLKKLQLMELAIMNGTYRGIEGNIVPFVAAAAAGPRTFST